jgi:hypothetical protein
MSAIWGVFYSCKDKNKEERTKRKEEEQAKLVKTEDSPAYGGRDLKEQAKLVKTEDSPAYGGRDLKEHLYFLEERRKEK